MNPKTFHNRRILVTGHTGFKGSWLCEWLLGKGAILCGYSDKIYTEPSLFNALGLGERMQDIRADIRDERALQKTFTEFKPELALHLAAQPLVRESYRAPAHTFDVNVMGTVQFLEATRACSAVQAAVVITTDKVYEAGSTEAFHENDRLGGHDPYSASKAACEIVFSSYQRSFFSSGAAMGSARSGNVIGGGDWSAERLIPDIIRAWRAQQPVVLRSPEAVRPWQHVLEPLAGYLAIAEALLADRARGESFNFGPRSSDDASVGEVVHRAERTLSGLVVKVDPSTIQGMKETHLLRLNSEKAKRELGWTPRLTLDEAVAWTLDWYRDFYSGKDAGAITRDQIAKYEKMGERASP